MNGPERLARASLLLDALYCVLIGVMALRSRAWVASLLRLPVVAAAAIGLAAVAWAAVPFVAAMRRDWRAATARVALANALATLALVVAAALHPGRGARALFTLLAVEISAFAVAGVIALISRVGREDAPPNV